ncbi:hypothetical protein [uncultured Jatrophihabitans sp.]|uniref:hypothetical protein n=1 Tax=uncultured Jatrophihabitans sp. TaxID=1610747 RepID=UPI0035CC3E66
MTGPDLTASANASGGAQAAAVPPGTRQPLVRDTTLLASLPVAVVAGAGLAVAGRYSSLGLVVALAVVQAALALAWVFGVGLPGRWGTLIIAGLASGGADFAACHWPHGRLGTLLAVLGLAVPVMYVHQLTRGAARVRVVASLGSVAVLVLAEVALPAYLQLRHEFTASDGGALAGRVVAAAVGAVAAAIVVGYLVDLIVPLPRFDVAVPRGVPALIAAAALGGAVGYLTLRGQVAFVGGRSAFVGAALGALAGLLAVAASFVLYSVPEPANRIGRLFRPAAGALLPLAFLAPAAFLICLSIRS